MGLLQDEAESVNLSAMSALRMLSESRDGCDLLLDAEAIVGFVGCLSEMKRQPILLGEALFSLGNMTKLSESIKQAMAAGAVDRLMALMSEGEEVSGVQMQALVLKCVWNIANLDEGKVAIIEIGGEWHAARRLASRSAHAQRVVQGRQDLALRCLRRLSRLAGVAQIAPCLTSADEDIRRLAVGALLALLVEQAGKEAAVEVRAVAVAFSVVHEGCWLCEAGSCLTSHAISNGLGCL